MYLTMMMFFLYIWVGVTVGSALVLLADLAVRFITDKRASLGIIEMYNRIGKWFFVLIKLNNNPDIVERWIGVLLLWLCLASFAFIWLSVLCLIAFYLLAVGVRKIVRIHYLIKSKMEEIDNLNGHVDTILKL